MSTAYAARSASPLARSFLLVFILPSFFLALLM